MSWVLALWGRGGSASPVSGTVGVRVAEEFRDPCGTGSTFPFADGASALVCGGLRGSSSEWRMSLWDLRGDCGREGHMCSCDWGARRGRAKAFSATRLTV